MANISVNVGTLSTALAAALQQAVGTNQQSVTPRPQAQAQVQSQPGPSLSNSQGPSTSASVG